MREMDSPHQTDMGAVTAVSLCGRVEGCVYTESSSGLAECAPYGELGLDALNDVVGKISCAVPASEVSGARA